MEDYVHCFHWSNAIGGRECGNLVALLLIVVSESNVAHGITLVDVGKQVPTCLAAIGDNFHVYVSIE